MVQLMIDSKIEKLVVFFFQVWCVVRRQLTFLSANFSGNICITLPLELLGDVSELLEEVFSDFVL